MNFKRFALKIVCVIMCYDVNKLEDIDFDKILIIF